MSKTKHYGDDKKITDKELGKLVADRFKERPKKAGDKDITNEDVCEAFGDVFRKLKSIRKKDAEILAEVTVFDFETILQPNAKESRFALVRIGELNKGNDNV